MSGNQSQAGITVLVTDKSCLQEKHSEHCLLIKETAHQKTEQL